VVWGFCWILVSALHSTFNFDRAVHSTLTRARNSFSSPPPDSLRGSRLAPGAAPALAPAQDPDELSSSLVELDNPNSLAADISPLRHAPAQARAVSFSSQAPTHLPAAGSSTKRASDFDGALSPTTVWDAAELSQFELRLKNYAKLKQKGAPTFSLYECVGLDAIESAKAVTDIGSKVMVDGAGIPAAKHRSSLPEVFIAVLHLNADKPSIMYPATDGATFSVVAYFRLTARARELARLLDEGSASPPGAEMAAVRLWRTWCRKAPVDDEWKARFKLVAQADSLAEAGFPSVFQSWNGKPVLIRKCGSVFQGNANLSGGGSAAYIGLEVNFHRFPYVAKQTFVMLQQDYLNKMAASLGYVIEAREEDELPEALIGSVRLRAKPARATRAEVFFSPQL
jgi:hypothetical protein